MIMSCIHCKSTGSLSHSFDGQLDCAYCDTAIERADLEEWAKKLGINIQKSDLWLIYIHGKINQAQYTIQLNSKAIDDTRTQLIGRTAATDPT